MGTFGDVPWEAADWEEPWCAVDEQAYLSGQDENILCGGEALAGIKLSAETVLEELQKMQVTYLNSIYDPPGWQSGRHAVSRPENRCMRRSQPPRLPDLRALCRVEKGSLWVDTEK